MNEDLTYMSIAFSLAYLSKAKRLKVGAVIVEEDGNIISSGYNRMPKELEQECEYQVNDIFVTKDELIHAEEEAIVNCAKLGIKCDNSTIFITDSPCLHCAKLIYRAGIKRVVYKRQYRLDDGIKFLKKVGIKVEQLKD